jgi:hypothetical protein
MIDIRWLDGTEGRSLYREKYANIRMNTCGKAIYMGLELSHFPLIVFPLCFSGTRHSVPTLTGIQLNVNFISQ